MRDDRKAAEGCCGSDAKGPHGYVLAFESTHAAMAADRALADRGAVLMPTPRAISAGCGMSLRLEAADEREVADAGRSVPEARGLMALYRIDTGGSYSLVGKL